MKRIYITPKQKWAIVEQNFLENALSAKEDFADDELGMEVKGQSHTDTPTSKGSAWDDEW